MVSVHSLGTVLSVRDVHSPIHHNLTATHCLAKLDGVTDAESGPSTGEGPSGTPRWVKTSALVAVVVVVVVVIVMVVSGGDHGPGRHSGGSGPPASVAEHIPPGGHGP